MPYKDPNGNRIRYRLNGEFNRLYGRAYYWNNREAELAQAKKDRTKNRLKILEMIGRGLIQCANCNCDNPDLLEIHHINGDGAKERRYKYFGSYGKFCTDIRLGKRSIDDLGLLCAVCNELHRLESRYGKLPYTITYIQRPQVQTYAVSSQLR